ncbi:MAG TPA: outer membrane lipoprotein chaperone LolA [Longimicrobium sp.]|jgi:outer membrane lipoprotein carrier protein
MIRSASFGVLLVALAACGGQESSADSPAQGVAPQRPRAETPAVAEAPVAGADTAAASIGGGTAQSGGAVTQPGAPSAAPAQAGTAPAAQPGAKPAAGQTAASTDDATEILRRTEQRADAIRTLEADFVQSLRVPLLNQNQNSAGKLYQRKPDRFLMRFTQPAGDVMVADGRYFWLYYPSTDRTQVIRTSIAKGGGAVDLQRQFIGNAAARFVATLNRSEVVDGHDSHALTLVPRQASPYKVLRIWVDKDDYTVRRFEMTEENESVRRVELRNIRVNGTIPDNLFSFTPPQGTQVFEQ